MSDDTTEPAEIIDFTTARMKKLAMDWTALGNYDAAEKIINALEQYMRGECLITFKGGIPVLHPVEGIKEEQ